MSKQLREKCSQAAFTLLEYAIAIPVLLGLGLAAIDVSRVLQTRSALEQATQTALRCVYTVQGRCVETSYAPPTAFYNWYRQDVEIDYLSDQFRYEGEGRFINVPTFTHNGITAQILSSVFWSQPGNQYTLQRVSYPSEGQPMWYVRTATLPYVTGTVANPSFRWNAQRGTTRARTGGYNPNRTLRIGRQQQPDGSYEWIDVDRYFSPRFQVPRRIPGARSDFESADAEGIDTPNPSAVRRASNLNYSNDTFDVNMHAILAETPIAVWVDMGNASMSPNGVVTIGLSLQEFATANSPTVLRTINLGGRQTGSATHVFLVPRGFPTSHVNSDMPDYSEWSDYTPVEVHYDRYYRFRVEFRVEDSGGNPNYNARVDVQSANYWTPNWNTVAREACDPVLRGVWNQSQQGGPAVTCAQQGQVRNDMTDISVDSTVNVDTTVLDVGCQDGPTVAISALGQMSAVEQASFDTVTGTQCGSFDHNQSCDAGFGVRGNYGVPQTAVGGRIQNSPQAQAICPAPNTPGVTNVSWSEVTVPVMNPANPSEPMAFSWEKSTCLTQAPPVPSPLSLVPANKLNLGPSFVSSHRELYTNRLHPDQFRQENPQYDCAELPGGAPRIYNSSTTPETSLFHGVRQDLGTSCFEEVLYEHAVSSLGMNPQQYLEVSRTKAGEQALESCPVGCDIECEIKFGDSGGETLVTPSPLPYGQTPVECQGSEVICRSELARIEGGGASEPVENLVAAAQFGEEEVYAAIPSSVRCNGQGDERPMCVQMGVEARQVGNTREYIAAASTKVPLLLMLGGSFEVAAQSVRAAELSFVR